MNLFKEFVNKLVDKGYSLQSIRIVGAEKELSNRLARISISKFCKNIGINRGSLYQMAQGRRAIPLDVLKKLNIQISNFRCIIKSSNIPIKIPTRLSPELAYLVGLLRDGTVVNEKNNEYMVAFYSKFREALEYPKKLLEKIFKIDVKIKRFGSIWGIRIRSLTLYLFFKLMFQVPQKQSVWNTPEIIKSGDNKIIKAYISGFWDAEGSCPRFENELIIPKKNVSIGFYQKNKEPLEFIKGFLEKKGIATTEIYWNERKWVLKIRRQSFVDFIDFIQPQNPIKLMRLQKVRKIFSL
jgi:intein/homing endonuclease